MDKIGHNFNKHIRATVKQVLDTSGAGFYRIYANKVKRADILIGDRSLKFYAFCAGTKSRKKVLAELNEELALLGLVASITRGDTHRTLDSIRIKHIAKPVYVQTLEQINERMYAVDAHDKAVAMQFLPARYSQAMYRSCGVNDILFVKMRGDTVVVEHCRESKRKKSFKKIGIYTYPIEI